MEQSFAICPFCLTIFAFDAYEGDLCPNCEVSELISLHNHYYMISSSFTDIMSQYGGSNNED